MTQTRCDFTLRYSNAVRRLAGKAMLLLLAYLGLGFVLLMGGFIAKVVGIWASILWGIIVILCIVLYARRRRESSV
jgi:ABC-type multidrug transport system permease subunit